MVWSLFNRKSRKREREVAQLAWDTSVLIYNNEKASIGTASLIAPNVLLTAAHCVSDFFNQSEHNVDDLQGYKASDLTAIKPASIHCDYDNDIAVIILKEPLKPPYAKIHEHSILDNLRSVVIPCLKSKRAEDGTFKDITCIGGQTSHYTFEYWNSPAPKSSKMEFYLAARPGNSGSAIFDIKTGEIISVVSATLVDQEDETNFVDVTYGASTSIIRKFVEEKSKLVLNS